MSEKRKSQIICILLLIVGLFYICTTKHGHGWGDDFALYLLHAQNICKGNNYADTGFIYNALAPSYSPQSYPPGFPLLISPLFAIFFLNFYAYKIFLIFFFLWAIWLMYLLLRHHIQFSYTVAILVLILFSPYMWEMHNNVLADFPAMAFMYLVFYLETKRETANSKLLACGVGVSTYIAFAMRSTGIVLIPALLYQFLFINKRKDKNFIFLALSFVIPALLQKLIVRDEMGYFTMLFTHYDGWHINKISNAVLSNANKYIQDFNSFTLLSSVNKELNILFTTVCFGLFTTGWYLSAKSRFSFIHMALLLLICIILIWPFYQGIRYLLPLLPFYVYYIFTSISHIEITWFRKIMFRFTILLFTIIYLGFYLHTNYGDVQNSVDEKENLEAFRFIKENTNIHAIIMSTKPRAFTLFTGRRGIVFPDSTDPSIYYKCLQDNNVDYIVTGVIDYNPYRKQNAFDDSIKFSHIFANNNFDIFKVNK